MSRPDAPLLSELRQGSFGALARALTLVENNLPGSEELLRSLQLENTVPVVGITGPPGAGKSTLVNALIGHLTAMNKKVGVAAIDPSSPFNYGALLGDRIRMAEHFTRENVFIRSLASRGSLGGLSEKAAEVTDVMREAGFDCILVETVGVGQSEVEVAGLADTTVVALVPEAGDEVQTMKAGLLEVADIFVVNKADRPEAEHFLRHLQALAHGRQKDGSDIPVLATVATRQTGIAELWEAISRHTASTSMKEKRVHLLTRQLYRLIQQKRMKDVDPAALKTEIEKALSRPGFNIYSFADKY